MMTYPELKIGDLTVKKPIIQGGMGIGISLSGLAGAVAKAGGVGVISTAQIGFREPDFEEHPAEACRRAIGKELAKAREIAPTGIIGFNIMTALRDYEGHVRAAVEAGADLIISGAGLPLDLPGLAAASQTKIAPIVSTERSAAVILKYWDRKYHRTADLVVIEGPKAGGHLGFSREQLEEYAEYDDKEYAEKSYDDEVKKMLKSLNQQDHYEEVKEWYDGYRFGNTDVYCPWDVVNYCADHLTTPNATPKNYWLNTSGNEVINHFIDSVGEPQKLAKTELERLVSGNVVRKRINETITYKELYSTIDNLWSTLFMTGYLTQRGSEDDGRYRLVIPNREIRNIVTDHILSLFQDEVKKDGQMANAFCQALMEGKEKEVERLLTAYMGKTISIRDTFVRKSIKENFYHGILLGILSFKTGWEVSSNRESGTGFSDILIEIDDSDIGIVIEVKYSDDEDQLEKDCKEALKQIKDRDYSQKLRDAGFHRILKYGIACQIKTCKVLVEI